MKYLKFTTKIIVPMIIALGYSNTGLGAGGIHVWWPIDAKLRAGVCSTVHSRSGVESQTRRYRACAAEAHGKLENNKEWTTVKFLTADETGNIISRLNSTNTQQNERIAVLEKELKNIKTTMDTEIAKIKSALAELTSAQSSQGNAHNNLRESFNDHVAEFVTYKASHEQQHQ
jgi:hypothetical protein